MSVLRKRSPWMLSTAVLGILSLGFAGCGGDDDDPFPQNPGLQDVIIVPQPQPVQAQSTASFAAGAGGTVSVTDLNPAVTGGVTGVTVVASEGYSPQNQTFGLAVVPTAQGTVQLARQADTNAFRFQTAVVEFVFGPVNADGTINPENVPDAPVDIFITLTEAAAQQLTNAGLVAVADDGFSIRQTNQGNRRMALYRVQNQGNRGQATRDPNCTPQFVRSPGRSGIVIRKCRGGRAIVTHRPAEHQQGGGHSG